MKNIISKFILLFTILGLTVSLNLIGQQSNTLYFMDKIPQAHLMNPANQPHCGFYVGLPIVSSVYFNYGNNGFAWSDIVEIKDGRPSIIDGFQNDLQDVNNLSFDTEFNLFALGARFGQSYLSFNLTQKNDFATSFPKGIVDFPFNGNGTHLGPDDPVDFSGFGLNVNMYTEAAFGISRKFGDKLTLGVRGKFYYGIFNLTTEKSDILWYTLGDYYDWKFTSDMSFRIASPVPFNLTDTTQEIGLLMDDFDPVTALTAFDNSGFGIDIGASFELTRRLTLSASLLDLGSINWDANTQTLTSKTEFTFTGLDVSPIVTGGALDLTSFTDSLVDGFDFNSNREAFTTKVPTKLHLGASYFLNDNWGLGVLYRSKMYEEKTFSSLTFSASTGLGNFLGLTGSYSIAYNSPLNIGLGMSLKLAFLQFYIVNDNVYGMVFPQHTRNINTRFGLNVTMGCRQKKKAQKAKKEEDMLRQQQEIDPTLFF